MGDVYTELPFLPFSRDSRPFCAESEEMREERAEMAFRILRGGGCFLLQCLPYNCHFHGGVHCFVPYTTLLLPYIMQALLPLYTRRYCSPGSKRYCPLLIKRYCLSVAGSTAPFSYQAVLPCVARRHRSPVLKAALLFRC